MRSFHLPVPHMGYRRGEGYDSARARWLLRMAAWKDAKAMWLCTQGARKRPGHWLKAFYGVPLGCICQTADQYQAEGREFWPNHSMKL